MCEPVEVREKNYDFSQQMDIIKGCKALIQAEVYIEEGMTDKSLKVLNDFLINIRDLNDELQQVDIEKCFEALRQEEMYNKEGMMDKSLNVIASYFIDNQKDLTDGLLQMDIKKSCVALIQAEVYMKEGMIDKSLKVLVDFMISQRYLKDDFNPLIIGFLLTYIIPREMNNTDALIDPLSNLILKESTKTLKATKDIKISNHAKEVFESIVEYTLKCISNICIANIGSDATYCKIIDDDDLFFSDSLEEFVNCLNPSLPPEILFSGGINTLLRMISILFHFNRIIETLANKFNNIIPTSKFEIFEGETLLHKNFLTALLYYCPFLFKQSFRINTIKNDALHKLCGDREGDVEITLFEVSRSNTLQNILDILPKEDPYPFWNFYFADEPGRGKGPNKEFYIKFSQDILRYDLNLWVGDPILSSNGIEYVYSKSGLFPSPCLELDEKSRNILRTLGILMAKSFIDGVAMDLNFSNTFWVFFLATSDELILSDDEISCMIPSHFEFYYALDQLSFDVKKIKRNTSLTTDQQLEALSELKYNGTKLEDLYINFTLPGYPDIELIDGGKDVFLNIENLREYTNSLVMWYSTKTPREKIKCIKNGFESIMGRYYRLFLKEDMIMMFSSIEPMQWTVAELKQNCVFDRYLQNNRELVKRLFKVLTSLSVDEQKQFLSFVTTFSRLPIGGLSSFEPRLTFDLLQTEGNPDEFLPMTFTCSNLLLIPNYSSANVLKQKLLLAIKEGGDYFSFFDVCL